MKYYFAQKQLNTYSSQRSQTLDNEDIEVVAWFLCIVQFSVDIMQYMYM